jgi:hypothetical protein
MAAAAAAVTVDREDTTLLLLLLNQDMVLLKVVTEAMALLLRSLDTARPLPVDMALLLLLTAATALTSLRHLVMGSIRRLVMDSLKADTAATRTNILLPEALPRTITCLLHTHHLRA